MVFVALVSICVFIETERVHTIEARGGGGRDTATHRQMTKGHTNTRTRAHTYARTRIDEQDPDT